MTTYEKIQYCSKLIEGAKGLGAKMEMKLPLTYKTREGHLLFNTNGVMDFVIGDVVSTNYEVFEFKRDRIMVDCYDKVLAKPTIGTIWYDEFEIVDKPTIKNYE